VLLNNGQASWVRPVGFAVTAAQKIDQHVVGQVLDGVLRGVQNDCVRRSGIADHEFGRNPQRTGGCHDAVTNVAKAVAILAGADRWIEADLMGPITSAIREGWTLKTKNIGVGFGQW
jgi:hypothetical protein